MTDVYEVICAAGEAGYSMEYATIAGGGSFYTFKPQEGWALNGEHFIAMDVMLDVVATSNLSRAQWNIKSLSDLLNSPQIEEQPLLVSLARGYLDHLLDGRTLGEALGE